MTRFPLPALAFLVLVALAPLASALDVPSHPAVKVDVFPRGISWPSPDLLPFVVSVFNNERVTQWIRVETHADAGSGWRLVSGDDDFVDLEIPPGASRLAFFTPTAPSPPAEPPESSTVRIVTRDLNASATLWTTEVVIERHAQPYGASIAIEGENWSALRDLAPGERRTFDLRVTNLEAAPLALYFRVWQPSSPFFEVAPRNATIDARSSTLVHVTIAAPENLREGFWASEDPVIFEAMYADRQTSAMWMAQVETIAPASGSLDVVLDAAAEHPVAIASGLATLAVLAVALLARTREWLQWLALAPLLGLYSRIRKPDALAHPLRARVHALVSATPGITLGELRAATRSRAGTLVHHLRVLEAHGLLASRRDGAFRRFLVPGVASFASHAALSVTPAERAVLRLLERGPLTQREIAEALGVTRQAANAHVKSLARAGRVRSTLADGEWRVALVDEPAAPSTP